MTTNNIPHHYTQSHRRLFAGLKFSALAVSAVSAVTLTIIAFAVQP
jgi:hypothetical protein